MVVIREFTPDDLDTAWRIRGLAFGGPREPDRRWLSGGWQGWIASLDGRPCGFARAWPYRQFFGGVAVPMAGLASVAVDPHARGRGVAGALLDAALAAFRERGQPLCALYASVVSLYRGRGWEQAGVNERVELAPSVLRSVPRPAAPVRLWPAGPDDLDALHECYVALASTVDGMLDRTGPPFELARVLELDVVTLAGGDSGLRGFVSGGRKASGLVLYDLVALDADAGLALLHTVGSWAGQLETVSIRLMDSRLLSPADLGVKLHSEPWMLRVVDFPAAVAARGWPRAALLRPGLTVDLELVDPHAPWHAGRHRLVVEEGAVRVSPGGDGSVSLTARGLAAWYAGAADTAALRRADLLTGDAGQAAVLDALTGTPGPARMADAF
jgi:predicted acetyltransferase